MITYGVKPNNNVQSWQSLGSHADGQLHTFSRFRAMQSGVSLHPLQRAGQVAVSDNPLSFNRAAAGQPGLGSATRAPAARFTMRLPPIVPIAGHSLDPQYRI